MTYGELLSKLSKLNDAELGQTVTVYDINNDDTYNVSGTGITGTEPADEVKPSGALDGYFYLVM